MLQEIPVVLGLVAEIVAGLVALKPQMVQPSVLLVPLPLNLQARVAH